MLFTTGQGVYAQVMEREGPYFHESVGVAFVQDINSVFGDVAGKLRFNPGLRLDLGAGYVLYSDSVFDAAVQFETGVIWAGGDEFTASGFSSKADADYYQVPILADFIYRFHFGERFLPYLGVGGGVVWSRLDLKKLDDYYYLDYTKDEWSPAVQAIAGLSYKLDERNEVGVGYKFLASFASGVDYVGTHSFSLTLVHRF